MVEDVRTMRGLNCVSDHFLVRTVIKQKLIRTQNNAVKQKKWNQSNLQNPAKLKQYRSYLYNKLIGKEIQQDMEEEWKNIEETIIESANEIIQTQNISYSNEWWDESCKLIMTQKNEARKKYLQTKTRASREIYEMKRTEANRVCREKMRIWINNKIKQLEETSNKNETNFFKEAQFFNKQQLVLSIFCKDKSGNILSEHGDILQRWKKYFFDLQSVNARFKELIPENTILNNLEEVPPPTYYEVIQVVKKLKTHKAAGSDNIPTELIKQDAIELNQRIH